MAIVGEEMGSHLQGSKSFFYVCFLVCLCVCFLGLGGLSCHWDFQTKVFVEPFILYVPLFLLPPFVAQRTSSL